jgi:hydroxymethylbilane synthase
MAKAHPLTIVSRKSRLALRQSELIKHALLALHPSLDITIIGINTTGDRFLDTPLSRIGGKGLFVAALEDYLLEKRADIAVHSLKDMPTQLPPDLMIGAIVERADPRDVWLSLAFETIEALPTNAHIGTSSLRRQAQLLNLRPDLKVSPLRGNIDTRISKLKEKHYDGIILAQCGVERLGLKDLDIPFCTPFNPHHFLPAVGQGALAIECRVDDAQTRALIGAIHHPPTAACVHAERAMLAYLKGGCQTPIAGYAHLENNQLILQGLVASGDGSQLLKATATREPDQMIALGEHVAQQLLVQGAGALLQHKTSVQIIFKP